MRIKVFIVFPRCNFLIVKKQYNLNVQHLKNSDGNYATMREFILWPLKVCLQKFFNRMRK